MDAICLDQANLDEKRQQVPLMGEIYAEASRVKIWFGGDEEMGKRAVHAIRSLKVVQECAKIDKDAVAAVLSHPWFRRRCTIQEALLHDDTVLHIGGSRVAWGEASRLLSLHARNLHFEEEHISHAIERIGSMRNLTRSVLSLMLDYHAADCSGHRDRIGALQGLVLTSSGRRLRHIIKDWPAHDPNHELLDPY